MMIHFAVQMLVVQSITRVSDHLLLGNTFKVK